MKKIFYFSLLFLFVKGFAIDDLALDYDRVAPNFPPTDKEEVIEDKEKEPTIPTEKLSNEVIIDQVQTVILTSFSTRVPYDLCTGTKGLVVYDLILPDNAYQKFQKRLEPLFCGKPLTERLMGELKNAIINLYTELAHPLVLVQIPEQDITDGTLIIEIKESVLEDIVIKGNKYFSKKQLCNDISLKKGKTINTNQLVDDLSWINRNPFRSASAIFSPGNKPYTTDVEISVKERFPLRVYGSLDNTGYKITDKWRANAGFNWGNAWNIGHIIGYQFTHSLSGNYYYSHTATYLWPFSWRHLLNIYGGYASEKGKQMQNFLSKGKSYQVSGRYIVPLPSFEKVLQEIELGADFKRTNNNLDSGEVTVLNNSLDVFQFVLKYKMTRDTQKNLLLFEIETLLSPDKFFPGQNKQLYDEMRLGSTPRYYYGKMDLQYTASFWKNSSFYYRIRGQLASENLLPTEQFGLGGFYTVRGYSERQVNVDNAILLNFEYHLPSIPLLSDGYIRHINDKLTVLAFFDYGLGAMHKKEEAANDLPQYSLMSIGPGIRYEIMPYLKLHYDYGFQLLKIKDENHVTGRPHFRLIISF